MSANTLYESRQNTPIFIIGTERSGSNLLRNMLDTNDSLCAPHPPHIFENFKKVIKIYGNLDLDQNLNRAIKDIVKFVNLHFNPWPFVLEEEEVKPLIVNRSLLGIKSAIYQVYANRERAKQWCCKSTFMINYTDIILDEFPNAKFILLVRNPLDVCLSVLKTPLGHKDIIFPSLRWSHEQRTGICVLENNPNTIVVRYEELISEPETTLKSICQSLDIKYQDVMISPEKRKKTSTEAKKVPLLRNTSKPIMSNNKDKFLNGLNKDQISTVISICKSEMEYFKYKTKYEGIQQKETFKSKSSYKLKPIYLYNRFKRIMNWFYAWKNYEFMLKHVRRRLFINRLKFNEKFGFYL
jgi:hypothetical protein